MASSPDRDDLTASDKFTSGRRRNNWTSTVDPTATDDETLHYEEGSRWLNTVTRVIWSCTDAAEGAALWSQGGVVSHADLEDLIGPADDHTQYALMESQDSDPGAPVRPEAFWYDSDATPSGLDYGEDADVSTLAYSDVPAAGTSDEIARADHVHGMPASGGVDYGEVGDISTLDYSDVPDAGVLDEAARADHVHGMPAPSGGGVDFGEVGDIVALAFGNAPAAGATGEVADAGHVHGMPSDPVDFGEVGDLSDISYGDAAAAGSTGEVADAGHQHAVDARFQHASLTFEFGPGAAVNDYRLVPIPWDFTPVGWRIIGDVAGACTIDLWMDVFANGQPTNADSITASATPAVAATNISASSTTLTGWDTTWVRGDLLKVVIEALTTMSQVTIEIYGNKT